MIARRRCLLNARPTSRSSTHACAAVALGSALLTIANLSRADDAPRELTAPEPLKAVASPGAPAIAASSTSAPAQAASGDKKNLEKAPDATTAKPHGESSRRAGVVLGFSLGGGLGFGSGYPNDAKYIDNESYRGATGALPGYGWNLFVLGAISRDINVGFWGGTSAFENANWKSRASGGGLRVEAFPFGGLVAALRNTALYTNLGIGSTKSELKLAGNYAALAGTQSFIAVGAFHEFHVTQRFTLAPDARFEAVVTRAGAHSAFIVGVRVAFHLTE
jgi:hypothetical protein